MFSFMLFAAVYFTQNIINLIFKRYQQFANFIVINVAIVLLMLRIMGFEKFKEVVLTRIILYLLFTVGASILVCINVAIVNTQLDEILLATKTT